MAACIVSSNSVIYRTIFQTDTLWGSYKRNITNCIYYIIILHTLQTVLYYQISQLHQRVCNLRLPELAIAFAGIAIFESTQNNGSLSYTRLKILALLSITAVLSLFVCLD